MIGNKRESNRNDRKALIQRIKDLKLPYSAKVGYYENDPAYHRLNIADAEDVEKINKAIDDVVSYGDRFMNTNPPPVIAVGSFPYDAYMSKYNSTKYIYVRDDVKEYRKNKTSTNPKRAIKKCKCK
jgi:hypothetical protein